MQDITESRDRAIRKQQWIFGEKLYRLGDPYTWMDGEDNPKMMFEGSQAIGFLQYLSMFFDYFQTPKDIITDDYDEMKTHIESVLKESFEHFLPFLDPHNNDFEKYILCTAVVRLQDYCFIRTFCRELAQRSINHLDVGPGLGCSSIYSLKGFNSCYYALEAVPRLYSVQRDFFRFLSK